MATIYKFPGGGQRVRQLLESGQELTYETDHDSDWPETAKVNGQSDFTNTIWNVDFETFKHEIEEWAGQEVELIGDHEYNSKQGQSDLRRSYLVDFLNERNAISVSGFARECQVSHSMLKFLLSCDRNMTEETWHKIVPVMRKYGFER